MNNEKVATQRLADIKALLDYVKEGIESIVNEGKTDQLDSMGQATLTILSTLRDIQEGIEKSEGRLIELHSKITEETFRNLEEPLEELLENIKSNASNQDDFLSKVVESYQSYNDSIASLEQTLKDTKKAELESYGTIDKKIDKISEGVGSIEEQIPKEVAYQASLKEINNSINRMVESERLNNDRHQEALDKVGGELLKAQELLTESNDVLDYIAKTYEQSTGRLSVLDMKLDTLTDILLENADGEGIGGIDND